MQVNKIGLSVQNAVALNRIQSNEELNEQPEIRDNKPKEKQYSADDVFIFLAAKNADYKIIIDKEKKADRQVAITVNDTDLIDEIEEISISMVDDFDEDITEPKKSFWGWLKNIFSGKSKVRFVKYDGDSHGLGDYYGGNSSTYGLGIGF